MPFLDLIHSLLPALKPASDPPEKLSPAPTEPLSKQDAPHACPSYTALKSTFRDIGRTNAIIETLGRDFLTAMPDGAYASRLQQITFLHGRMHEDLATDETRALLDKAQEHAYAHPDAWDEWDRANVREMLDHYRMEACLSQDLIEKRAHASYAGRRQHCAVKASGDWTEAEGYLREQVDLNRAIAEARCESFGDNAPYQMLLQDHLPGMNVSEIDTLFSTHKQAIDSLLPRILEHQGTQANPAPLEGTFDAGAQMWLNRSLLRVIGFDFERGGLYETGHNPVEGGTPEDTRLVISKVDPATFLTSMKSALHEGGHGLYIQGLPRHEWRYQPVAMDLGAGIHESQALLIEMLIGRMPAFFRFIGPRVEGAFHAMNTPSLSADNVFALKTRVSLSLDRKQADEVTYFYHILMRYRLERDLIEGRLDVRDLPEAWAEGCRSLFGQVPDNVLQGCVQDVHWFVGKFGYFPSYVVGHMLAAQLYHVMKHEIEGVEQQIQVGDFSAIRGWLAKAIYAQGRLLPADALIKQATGEGLNPAHLKAHLKHRYLST